LGKNHHIRPLRDACKAAKIRPAVAFHELRHTYASHLAQAGVDLLTISKLFGHSDTRITSKHYAHQADKTLVAAVTRLPSFAASNALVTEPPGRRKRSPWPASAGMSSTGSSRPVRGEPLASPRGIDWQVNLIPTAWEALIQAA